jgi:hypothetical protein
VTALEFFVAAVAAIGFTPITIVTIGNVAATAKQRRRDAMLDRFWDRL